MLGRLYVVQEGFLVEVTSARGVGEEIGKYKRGSKCQTKGPGAGREGTGCFGAVPVPPPAPLTICRLQQIVDKAVWVARAAWQV